VFKCLIMTLPMNLSKDQCLSQRTVTDRLRDSLSSLRIQFAPFFEIAQLVVYVTAQGIRK
jgi:hypothetical protein